MNDTRNPTPFSYCLNTSTIRGQGLSLPEMIEVAAEAGYQGIEPWVSELDAYVADGGSLDELSGRLSRHGLRVPNLIGFFAWGVDDPDARRQGFAEARRNMETAARIGCQALAAAPMGLVEEARPDFDALAERYAELIVIGREYGVTPMLEFWGLARTLGRLGEALFVAAECGQAEACILADVFHMFKGSGTFEGLKLLGPRTLGLLHLNDYPADPPRSRISDAGRVFPGDGIAPLGQILRDVQAAGYAGMLSLELFNEAYWRWDALHAATTGLQRMKDAVRIALA